MTGELVPTNPGEFLFYQTEDGQTRIEVRIQDETVWLSQKGMAELFGKDVRTIHEHIRNLFDEAELQADSVIRNFRITASDGKRYDTQHYNLDVIISVGYRIDLLVGDEVIVEIKSVEKMNPVFSKQLLTYLRLSGKRWGLLINFNVGVLKDGIERIVNGY